MQLHPSTELISDVNEIIGSSVKDPQTAIYVNKLLLSPPIAEGIGDIRINFFVAQGLEFVELRMDAYRRAADKCFVAGVFGLDYLFRRDDDIGYMILDFGKRCYNIAGIQAFVSREYEQWHVYSDLSDKFIPVVADLSYSMG